MRVYHFVPLAFGLDDLRRRRLKIARLDELNDPFELFGVNLKNPILRQAFRTMKSQLGENRGLLCFSRSWQNPVQWGHYAEKRRGLCLGFDIPDENLGQVSYAGRRLAVEAERFLNPEKFEESEVTKLLFTKFSHWKYENEVRAFVTLEDQDPETGLYFAEFSDRMTLRQIIVGPESTSTKAEVLAAIGNLQPVPEIFKARLAFASFKVVRQQKTSLWL